LLPAETNADEWLFHQEKATLIDAGKCMGIGESLYNRWQNLSEVQLRCMGSVAHGIHKA